jgi:hypothetical protein
MFTALLKIKMNPMQFLLYTNEENFSSEAGKKKSADKFNEVVGSFAWVLIVFMMIAILTSLTLSLVFKFYFPFHYFTSMPEVEFIDIGTDTDYDHIYKMNIKNNYYVYNENSTNYEQLNMVNFVSNQIDTRQTYFFCSYLSKGQSHRCASYIETIKTNEDLPTKPIKISSNYSLMIIRKDVYEQYKNKNEYNYQLALIPEKIFSVVLLIAGLILLLVFFTILLSLCERTQ